MKKRFLLLSLIFGLAGGANAQTSAPLPKFDEVYQLLRTNAGGLSEAELNRAAVRGLLEQLNSRVVLVTNTSAGASNSANISKTTIYDAAFGYFRVAEVESGLNDQFKSSFQSINSTNKLKGLVLDLRFAGGTDYEAAAEMADLFLKNEQPLLRWGEEAARSIAKTNYISIPVAVLVNHDTSGAAEALAGILRDANVGLVIGTNTAGQASVFETFPLSNGQRLKIATAPVLLGSGNEIPAGGLKADIDIALSAEEEKKFYENPFYEPPKIDLADFTTNNASTVPPRRRLNEAELVRMQREGISIEEILEETAQAVDEKPGLSDPALVRALDLLKGLSVVRQSRK